MSFSHAGHHESAFTIDGLSIEVMKLFGPTQDTLDAIILDQNTAFVRFATAGIEYGDVRECNLIVMHLYSPQSVWVAQACNCSLLLKTTPILKMAGKDRQEPASHVDHFTAA